MYFSFAEEIKKYPFIRLTIPCLIGITISLCCNFPSWISYCILALSGVCFLILKFIPRYSVEIWTGISINTFLLAAGMIFTSQKLSTNISNNKIAEYKGFMIGEISDDPKIKENNISLEINVTAIKDGDKWIETSGKTILYIEKDSLSQALCIGDKIVFNPDLSEIENKGNPEEFDYKKYLAYNMIYSSDYLASDDWKRIDNQTSDFRVILSRFRIKLIELLRSYGLSEDELSVMSAMTMGYSDTLSDEIRHAYSSAGAMHILAVSGLHVGIIYGIIIFLLSFIKNEKFNASKVVITIALIWLYAIFTGLSPSVSRAALMFSIMSLGKLQRNYSGSLNGVFASMFILLIINPLNIINIGFQLSYSAVIGIIILQPKLYELIEVKNKFLNSVWSLTTVSVAAQIATAPLGIYYFHQFSNYFLITNYILIPISTIAIWTCIIFFAFSWFPFLAKIIAWCLSYIAKAMNFACLSIESLPYSTSENLYINGSQLILIYTIIVLLVIFFFFTKKYKHLFAAVLISVLYLGTELYQQIETKKQKAIVIYNINKATTINIIDGADNIMFANLDSVKTKDIEFSTKNNWLKKGLDKEKYINLSSNKDNILSTISTIDNKKVFFKNKFIRYNNVNIYVLDDNFMPDKNIKNKVDVDFVILSNNPQISLNEIPVFFNFKQIIIDSSNGDYRIEQWQSENEETKLKLYNIKQEGAFIYEL